MKKLAFSAALAACCAVRGLAADGTPLASTAPVQLPDTTVTANRDRSTVTVPDTAEAARRIDITPGGVNVVDAETYLGGRALNLRDIFEYTPGVIAQPRFGAEETRLSIRGSGLQRTFHLRGIQLLQDNIPINSTDGSADFQSIEPLALQYVEAYRGANALQYGSSTLGGAINFVSHTGATASPLQGRVEYGSYDYMKLQASSGMQIGPVDYYVSASHYATDGFRDHSRQDSERIFSNIGFQLSENVETRLYLTAVDSDSQLPGNLTKAQLESDPRQANPANLTGNQRRDEQFGRVASKTTIRGDEQELQIGFYWNYTDLHHPIFQFVDNVSNDTGAVLHYRNEQELFGRRNVILAGMRVATGWTEARRFVNINGSRGSLTAKGKQNASAVELYGEEQHYILDQLALVVGGQFIYADRDFDDNFLTDGNHSSRQQYYGFTPKVGARYEFGDAAQLFANVSRSFEPPSYGELVNNTVAGAGLVELDAQTAWTFEIGTRGRVGPLGWDAAFYWAMVDDELLSYNVGPGGASLTVNADETVHRGVELGFDYTIFEGIFDNDPLEMSGDGRPRRDRLVLRAAYNWSDFRFDSDPTWGDNRLPGVPPHLLRAQLLYDHPCGFYFGPNMEFAGRAPVDMANDLYADSYALMGFEVGYRTRKGFSMFFEIRNILDETYAASTGVITRLGAPGVSAAQFLPGDGRSVFIGAEWRF